ncbi:hypothetical protein F5X99DRAFT_416122 [Biscogniauxia marginata]|nr:hypothetical protein F5X99DRAFT_416122 [Biscogniauxia marginata]
MAASDRLRCPLLRCGERFEDHESMLRHLTKCQYLSTGEYVCYECMKVERLDDKKCKCCLGHPTKRRRIINMAKNFFSNIGNKSRQGSSTSPPDDDLAFPPPTYESLVVDTQQLYEEQARQRHWQHQQQQHRQEEGNDDIEMHEPPQQPQLELNGTELLELDSTPLLPTAQLDAINYESQSTNAPTSSNTFQEQPNSMLPPSVDMIPQDRNSSPHHDAPSLQSPMPSTSGGRRPSLALDTHLDRYRSAPRQTYLSPSSSLRSTKSSQGVSPITPWSASSKSSCAWAAGSNIDTALTSPITPFSARGYPAASTTEYSVSREKYDSRCPPDPCSYTLGGMPELPGDNPLSTAFRQGQSDPLFFSFNPKDNYSWMSSVDTEISLGASVNMMFTNSDSNPENMPSEFVEPPDSRSETRALVLSAWDALQEHVSTSISKLANIRGNSLANRFQGQTVRTIALTGLSSLKKILSGNDPTDPFDYLCFVHVMYAFSLVMHEYDMITRFNKFYTQALAYRGFLDPAYLDVYSQVVSAIWQPTLEQQPHGRSAVPLSRSSSLKGKDSEYRTDSRTAVGSDPLVIAGQNFLDALEASVVSSDSQRPAEVLTSELWSTHVAEKPPNSSQNNPFAITANYIVRVLSQNFHDHDGLVSRLKVVSQRIHTGHIDTVRRLELDLTQAGKDSLESSDRFDEFIPGVRELCDQIYSQQGFHSRMRYQVLGVSLIETLVRSIAQEPQQPREENSDFQLNLPDPFDEFLQNLDKTFPDSTEIEHGFLMPMESVSSVQQQQQPDNSISDASNFDPIVDPTTLDRAAPSAQVSNPLYSKPLTTTASRPETPGEPFTVPTVSSPDFSRAIATTTSSSPGLITAPTHAPSNEGFGSSASGEDPKVPSSSSSGPGAGQKVEASDCCEICGYRPKGDPQWFKGSMAKHKKLQHSTGPPTIYKCPYPGCSSQYKNRQDNLRQHQIEKNHFVGDETTGRRPSKRKKTS